MKRHRLLERAHLETLLVALALIDESLVDAVDESRLSPAANALLDLIAATPFAARADLPASAQTFAGDEYVMRLATRVTALSVGEMVEFSRDTVTGLCNRLPAISAKRNAA